jgi:mRNA interferase MazF
LPARSTGLRQDSKAQAEQIRSIAVGRLGERIGTIPAGVMVKIDEALRLHLAL